MSEEADYLKQKGRREYVKDPKCGRKKFQIDETQLRKLATMQATYKELGAFFECNPDTIENHYRHVIDECRENGKLSLRRAQFRKAIDDGDGKMMIWLGKQYLKQKDTNHMDVTKELVLGNQFGQFIDYMKAQKDYKQVVSTDGDQGILPKAD